MRRWDPLGHAGANDIVALLPVVALAAAAAASARGLPRSGSVWRVAPAWCACALAAGTWLGWGAGPVVIAGGALAVDAAAVLAGLMILVSTVAELARRGHGSVGEQAHVLCAAAVCLLVAMAAHPLALGIGGAVAGLGRRVRMSRPDLWRLRSFELAFAIGALRVARLMWPDGPGGWTPAVAAAAMAAVAWGSWRIVAHARTRREPLLPLDDATLHAGLVGVAIAVPGAGAAALLYATARYAAAILQLWTDDPRLPATTKDWLARLCAASTAGCPPLAGGVARALLALTAWRGQAQMLAAAIVVSTIVTAGASLWQNRHALPGRETREDVDKARKSHLLVGIWSAAVLALELWPALVLALIR